MAGGSHDVDCRSGGRPEGGRRRRPGLLSTCGLKPLPHIVRLFILDEGLRQRTGDCVTSRLARRNWLRSICRYRRVYIVENLQTGLAFEDYPDRLCSWALVTVWAPWRVCHGSCGRSATYWGDLDTHGLAILSRARLKLPHLESALMDEHTLLRHRDLWVSGEPAVCSAGASSSNASRTIALLRAETAAVGSERSPGTGTHRLELRLGRASGVDIRASFDPIWSAVHSCLQLVNRFDHFVKSWTSPMIIPAIRS